jgi:hypothetical protein
MGRGTCANQPYRAPRLGKNPATSKDRDIRGAVSVKVVVGSPDSYALCDNIKLEDLGLLIRILQGMHSIQKSNISQGK